MLLGLSLCIQGTLGEINIAQEQARFIPVHTGNTFKTFVCNVIWPVYPCAYREHDEAGEEGDPIGGLSLCIQGTPACPSCKVGYIRFIPVHTGNTECNSVSAIAVAVYPCAYREH